MFSCVDIEPIRSDLWQVKNGDLIFLCHSPKKSVDEFVEAAQIVVNQCKKNNTFHNTTYFPINMKKFHMWKFEFTCETIHFFCGKFNSYLKKSQSLVKKQTNKKTSS